MRHKYNATGRVQRRFPSIAPLLQHLTAAVANDTKSIEWITDAVIQMQRHPENKGEITSMNRFSMSPFQLSVIIKNHVIVA